MTYGVSSTNLRVRAAQNAVSTEGTQEQSDEVKRRGYLELIRIDTPAIVSNIRMNEHRDATKGQQRIAQQMGEAEFEPYSFNECTGRATTVFEMTHQKDYKNLTIVLFIPDNKTKDEPSDPEDALLIAVRRRRRDTDIYIYDPDRYKEYGYEDSLSDVATIWAHLIGLADFQFHKVLHLFIDDYKKFLEENSKPSS